MNLTITDLSLAIGGQKIIQGLSTKITSGETVGIIGPNGSGKTTLFNCLSGFLSVTSGSILYNDEDITTTSPAERALKGLGRVFQNPGIFRDMTLIENIQVALEAKASITKTFFPWSKTSREIKKNSIELLKQINLFDKRNDKAGNLSGGQMRLLEIIRTIAGGADLFLLDEPTAGVSPKMKDAVADLIISIKQQGKTILIIEHDINFIQKFCTRILVLDSGKIILDNTPEVVRADPKLQEIYFGNH